MTGAAGGPERPPESASFEIARIAGRRLPASVAIIAFVGLLGAFVAVGILGRNGPGAGTPSPVAIAPKGAAASGSPGDLVVTPVPSLPEFAADDGPLLTSGPGELQILVKRHPQTVYVHGDVFVPRVTWVFLSVRDDIGNVAGWASVSVPGAAGPGTTAGPGVAAGPTLRFDVELALRGEFAARLWVQAQAYDAGGQLVGTARVELPDPAATPGAGGLPDGSGSPG